MGSPNGEGETNEHPQHSVTVKDFQMGKYEATFEQYDEFTKASCDLFLMTKTGDGEIVR